MAKNHTHWWSVERDTRGVQEQVCRRTGCGARRTVQLSAVAPRSREKQSGRYGFEGGLERVCVCGHTLGAHTAAAPHECGTVDPRVHPEAVGCECRRFRPSRAGAVRSRRTKTNNPPYALPGEKISDIDKSVGVNYGRITPRGNMDWLGDPPTAEESEAYERKRARILRENSNPPFMPNCRHEHAVYHPNGDVRCATCDKRLGKECPNCGGDLETLFQPGERIWCGPGCEDTKPKRRR